jgi:isopentenyl-diphosphate delta-isomerase
MSETQEFERRKQDHIQWSLSEQSQSPSHDLDQYQFRHEALPEHNFNEVRIDKDFWGYRAQSPFFISSMTAGHFEGEALNLRLAQAASLCRWPMGVGSQRRELFDPQGAALEWKRLKKQAPETCFFGNIGITQVITHSTDVILKLVESLEAKALIVHLNPLQEVIQREGTPFFKGGLQALEKLCQASPVPIIAKEVGCGIDAHTARRLFAAGVTVVDVAGRGGTHWGLVEGLRAKESGDQLRYETSLVFGSWGLSTVSALRSVVNVEEASLAPHEVWASGGVRHGLDAAKLLALGAKAVGLARPLLLAASQSLEALVDKMKQLENELKIATFCLGYEHCAELNTQDFYLMPPSGGCKA